jgi:hypothetical protein
MTAAELIRGIHRHGGDVALDGDDLNLSAPQPFSADLLHQVRDHKAELLAYLNPGATNIACEGLSLTPEQLRQELEAAGDLPDLVPGALTPKALSLTARALALRRESETPPEICRRNTGSG